MRPRFSIRLLLVAVVVLAAICYLLFARPTVMAERFVAAVMGRDYQVAQSLLHHRDLRSLRNLFGVGTPPGRRPTTKVVLVYAEVLPREWADIWSFHRRVIFRVAFADDTDGRHVEWTEDTQMVASMNGLKVI